MGYRFGTRGVGWGCGEVFLGGRVEVISAGSAVFLGG